MTKQTQPIDLPSYELVQKLMHESGFMISDPGDEMEIPAARFMKLASRLIQHGADQELKACCEWLKVQETCSNKWFDPRHDACALTGDLRAARRPKPPSLKEQALEELEQLRSDANSIGMGFGASAIRRALETLPE
jgi:hypothetical protein